MAVLHADNSCFRLRLLRFLLFAAYINITGIKGLLKDKFLKITFPIDYMIVYAKVDT